MVAATPTTPPTKKSLFDIGTEMEALEAIIADAEGDISDPVADAAITQALEQLGEAQAVKADGYVSLIRKWEMEEAAAKEEAERYAMAAKVRTNRVKGLKERLKQFMERTGQKKLVTATGRQLRVQSNSKRPVEWLGEIEVKHLPEQFQKVTVSADMAKIEAALKAGEELAFARLGVLGSHLRIA